MKAIKVTFQDDSNGRGWCYYDEKIEGWMPCGGTDPDEVPTIDDLLADRACCGMDIDDDDVIEVQS
jgi:hypothetical protein